MNAEEDITRQLLRATVLERRLRAQSCDEQLAPALREDAKALYAKTQVIRADLHKMLDKMAALN